ncbi:killer toxin alpha/beta [Nannizzia gypsea CBS 118893]|uniref:chitinase n=1 Tax=Arthroderma gypseum (strain ATCC MYA-4604 / CBS 118893) TaxID=535722 RepID=E4V1K1_ARTGP|nr:killer toxin alpha/beta [Nannizzia gypsea CBS 118893]EFR03916.1 killer toxin alpha/beta [Nannizzia gypsea CBS 118893]
MIHGLHGSLMAVPGSAACQPVLSNCKKPLLFDLNVYNDDARHSIIRACTVDAGKPKVRRSAFVPIAAYQNKTMDHGKDDLGPETATSMSITASTVCGAKGATVEALFTANPPMLNPGVDTASAAALLATYTINSPSCGETILLAKTGAAIVGLYLGAEVQAHSAGELINKFGCQGTQVVQSCNVWAREARTVGLFAVDDIADLDEVQRALKKWSRGGCLDIPSSAGQDIHRLLNLGILTAPQSDNSTNSHMVAPTSVRARTSLQSVAARTGSLTARGDCNAIQVVEADSCAALAARCGIRGKDFLKFNPKPDLCTTLVPKQWICCSEGTVPDMRPKPQADGTCATYTISSGDGCWAMADNFGITQDNIEKFNKKTWGWAGCSRLQPGQVICLSNGNSPMPAQIEGVSCGPQMPGTKKPSGPFNGSDLAKLNPCPLNACCSGWGFCGVTAEFCTESLADTGAPGSSKPGTNSCISNCGTDIVGNESPGTSFNRIGYFQAYNTARSCLNMDVTEIEGAFKDLTHVHFAFAGLTEDFDVHIDDTIRDQFDKFKAMQAPFKKIVSIGGWAQSTDQDTYKRYRDAMLGANRAKFIQNIVNFINANNLDGIDIDWEYPGASDQGIPASDPIDAENYLRFLAFLREALPRGEKSMSIALPASYWYLKAFPIRAMNVFVDYFIYMTYDLHGQWDYGNKFVNPGCPNGNCLRSHVNRTETYNSLAMITKAGVLPWAIMVGISSYGRSFRMSDPSCTGPMCTFTGSYGHSEAEPGKCTDTPGYIANAELNEILTDALAGVEGVAAQKWHDPQSDSDIISWSGQGVTDWVAYMDDDTKAQRIEWVRSLNLGGTTDWAIDLANWNRGPDKAGGWTVESDNLQCDSTTWPTTLDDLEKNIGKVQVNCRGRAVLSILAGDLQDAIAKYREVSSSSDYNDRFKWYADWVKDSINARLEKFMAFKTGEGLKYMDCKWSTNKVKGQGPCTEMDLTTADNKYGHEGTRVIEYTMRDEEQFYIALQKEAGIDKEWIQWKDYRIYDPFCRTCPPKADGCHPDYCGDDYILHKNFPRRIEDKDKITVESPKDTIDKAIPYLDKLSIIAIATLFEMQMGVLDADAADVVTSFSMPLFMLQDASKSIEEIKKIGKEEKDKKTKELVLMVLSIVFAVIPFAGFVGQAVGVATRFAAAALIIGEIGSAAVSIVEIIDNPASAPFAILGILIGAEGIELKGARTAFKEAAAVRRALTGKSLASFSEEFVRKDAIIQGIIKSCFR